MCRFLPDLGGGGYAVHARHRRPRRLLRNCSVRDDRRRSTGPGGRHLHAVRGDDGSVAGAIGGRRLADDVAEGAAERPEAAESDVEADIGDAAISLAQEEHGALHAPALEVAMRGLAEDGAEAADEVRLRDVRDRGDGADIERLGVGAIHRIPRAEEASVELLDVAAHAGTLRHR
jgi:hypothetical protein